jgi:hypothetical protein
MHDRIYTAVASPNEKAPWNSFKMVTADLLGNVKAENYDFYK